MRQLHAPHVEPLLDAQQAPVHQGRERAGRRAGLVEAGQQPLLGHVLAESRAREQVVLDDLADRGRLIGERPLVEAAQRSVARMRAGEQVERDLLAPLGDARVIQFAADEAQERGLDLGMAELGAAGDEAHDGGGHLLVDQPLAWFQHRGQGLLAGHAREPQAVLGDAGHGLFQALERRQIVFAQRDQHAVVRSREVELLGAGLVGVELGFEFLRRAVLNEVGKIRNEARGACAPEVVALREREDLLELIEYQQRRERAPRLVAQHVVAMVQELPQGLALDGDTHLGPLAGEPGAARDRFLDLLRGLGRVAAVVDAHVNRAVALAAQARHEARAQDRGLAEARLAKQYRQELALHAAGELSDLRLAAIEILACLLSEGGEARSQGLRSSTAESAAGGSAGRCTAALMGPSRRHESR